MWILTLNIFLICAQILIVLIDAAWFHRQSNGHVYYFSDIEKTWEQARHICENKDASLVTVNDDNENNFLYSKFNENKGHWIGLHCAKTINLCTSVSDLEWHSSETTNYEGDFGEEMESGWTVSVFIDLKDKKWKISYSDEAWKHYICEKEDGCQNGNPCKNGGTCIPDNTGGSSCRCKDDFTGNKCQNKINDCESHECVNGNCVDGTNAYSCNCRNGYTGRLCESDIDECAISENCQHGHCFNTIGSYSCNCYAGYTGNKCHNDINECNRYSHLCKNGATCENIDGSYECACKAGFEGHNCSININECESNPCMNEGNCTDEVNGYRCDCTEQYTGARCDEDIDECSLTMYCGSGNCFNTHGGFTCECSKGYGGDYCTDIDECKNKNKCNLNGNCTNTEGGYFCNCFEGYADKDDCSAEKDSSKQIQDDGEIFKLKIALFAGCGILFLCLVVFVKLVIDDRIYQRRINARDRIREDQQNADSQQNTTNTETDQGPCYSNAENIPSANTFMADSFANTSV